MSKILEVGTKIRSYDFFGVVHYYVEGVIVEVDTWNYCYKVSLTKTVVAGVEKFDDRFVMVDFVGRRIVDAEWDRIEVIV